ncbi:MAG TPA: hypothetical protein VFB12_00105 [Ktedonobacteraceae bacterium]|nr:hypothetical protein [Ktedonobacteraceae bacterium]
MARNIVEHPLSPDLTDQCLLERCSAGDQRAFEMLVQRYQGSLSLFVSKYLGHEEALDVVQGILLQLYLSLPTLHRKPSPLATSRHFVAGSTAWPGVAVSIPCVSARERW